MPASPGVTTHRGDAAERLLGDARFRRQWADLAAACAWASVFQSHGYLGAWYRIYRDSFEPLLVIGVAESGTLEAMLPLAVGKRDGRLVVAGCPHAEYYGWLSRHEDGAFLDTALSALQPSFPDAVLDFRYLPPGTPVPRWSKGSRWRACTVVEAVQRPLIDLRGEAPRINGTNKTKWNRLRRFGDLDFRQVCDIDELAADLNAVVDYCDFRQAAADRPPPFRADPCKLPFYLALFEEPGLLHATVLRLNGRPIAAHIGYRNRNEVSLGVLAHSPFFNRHSPGALHLLLLSQLLAAQGIGRFDLTPQGAYKERFATAHDSVTRLTVYFSRPRLERQKRNQAWLAAARRGLQALSLTPTQARRAVGSARHFGRQAWQSRSLRGAAAALHAAIGWPVAIELLKHDGLRLPETPDDIAVSRDSLDHLLAYEPYAPHHLPKAAFLQDAMRRLEQIDANPHVFTAVEGGVLVAQGWTRTVQEANRSVPAGSVLLEGFDSHPHNRAQRLRGCVARMLRDASSAGAVPVFAAVRADDTMVLAVLGDAGFRPWRSDENLAPDMRDVRSGSGPGRGRQP